MKRRKAAPTFKPYIQNQPSLLPPSLDELIPINHPVRVVNQVVDSLDLRVLLESYEGGGSSSYHPAMLLKVIVYAYLRNIYSTRRMEEALTENIRHFGFVQPVASLFVAPVVGAERGASSVSVASTLGAQDSPAGGEAVAVRVVVVAVKLELDRVGRTRSQREVELAARHRFREEPAHVVTEPLPRVVEEAPALAFGKSVVGGRRQRVGDRPGTAVVAKLARDVVRLPTFERQDQSHVGPRIE